MISIVIPLYVNLEIPIEALNHYNRIAEEIEVIVVDDGSPVNLNYNDWPEIIFIRLGKDIPWNQPTANNIGVRAAMHPYIFRCDIDHLISEDLLDLLRDKKPDKGEAFKFRRIKDGQYLMPNKNIFLINKSDFYEGYNEGFSGNYGHDDTEFLLKRRLKERTIQEPLRVLGLKTHDLIRDKSHNENAL